MDYKTELRFVEDLLQNYRLHIVYLDKYTDLESSFLLHDWMTELLNLEIDREHLLENMQAICKPNTIYQSSDSFLCHHLLFQLPGTETPAFAYIGPYTPVTISKQDLDRVIEKHPIRPGTATQLAHFYHELPLISDESLLLNILYTLGTRLWGSMSAFHVQRISDIFPVTMKPVLTETEIAESELKEFTDSNYNMHLLEERYETEYQLIQAISTGQTPKAELLLANLTARQFEPRSVNNLRSIKNYLLSLNTLLRLSASHGSVHPFHVDRISSQYAQKIELITSMEGAASLPKEMVRKYCLLVKNHSMRGYSLLIRKVLTHIDFDLTADLSLKVQAKNLNVNPSYLSALFKKETGMTLTEYVNQKRVEHALFLLNSSNMQIQAIAQYCGIPDVNYFTKTFKKIIGKTPKEYRDTISIPLS